MTGRLCDQVRSLVGIPKIAGFRDDLTGKRPGFFNQGGQLGAVASESNDSAPAARKKQSSCPPNTAACTSDYGNPVIHKCGREFSESAYQRIRLLPT